MVGLTQLLPLTEQEEAPLCIFLLVSSCIIIVSNRESREQICKDLVKLHALATKFVGPMWSFSELVTLAFVSGRIYAVIQNVQSESFTSVSHQAKFSLCAAVVFWFYCCEAANKLFGVLCLWHAFEVHRRERDNGSLHLLDLFGIAFALIMRVPPFVAFLVACIFRSRLVEQIRSLTRDPWIATRERFRLSLDAKRQALLVARHALVILGWYSMLASFWLCLPVGLLAAYLKDYERGLNASPEAGPPEAPGPSAPGGDEHCRGNPILRPSSPDLRNDGVRDNEDRCQSSDERGLGSEDGPSSDSDVEKTDICECYAPVIAMALTLLVFSPMQEKTLCAILVAWFQGLANEQAAAIVRALDHADLVDLMPSGHVELVQDSARKAQTCG